MFVFVFVSVFAFAFAFACVLAPPSRGVLVCPVGIDWANWAAIVVAAPSIEPIAAMSTAGLRAVPDCCCCCWLSPAFAGSAGVAVPSRKPAIMPDIASVRDVSGDAVSAACRVWLDGRAPGAVGGATVGYGLGPGSALCPPVEVTSAYGGGSDPWVCAGAVAVVGYTDSPGATGV